MVKLDDKDLFQLLVAELRYAIKRDNHLAPSTCAQHIKDYLPEMSKQWRTHSAKQLSEEIIDERLWHSHYLDSDFKFEQHVHSFLSETPKKQLDEDYVWEDLLVFLTNHLETLPHNADRYMEHIYGRMTYSEGIDYYSTNMNNRLVENKTKAK